MREYPKRLIEVDLPIKRISEHARREKSIRHGHISTLHIWWARRPLAACRSVICASLWFDPADPLCSSKFREEARTLMRAWVEDHRSLLGAESFEHFEAVRKDPSMLNDDEVLRTLLLDFVADFANWDNSTNPQFLETSRALTQAAHLANGGESGTRPLVVDPFAGGGSIPLEALRVGADAFASDLNPVAVLLNKVVLEYIPRYGNRLAVEVRKWGSWILREAEKELNDFYPKDADGATPVAYIWSRTVECEGPGCGAELPLIRSPWLSKKQNRMVALGLTLNAHDKSIEFEILKGKEVKRAGIGTVKRSSANCPICGYTTPAESVRKQISVRQGGSDEAMLLTVVLSNQNRSGREYRIGTARDLAAIEKAKARLSAFEKPDSSADLGLIPTEELPYLRSIFNINLLGINTWGKLFAPRQILTILTLVALVKKLARQEGFPPSEVGIAVRTCLAMAVDRHIDQQSSLVTWIPNIEAVSHTFVRQALGITWDFCEPSPISESGGNIAGAIEWVARVIDQESRANLPVGSTQLASAAAHPLPDDSAEMLCTDPPYYDAVPYADLSDFFYVWLRRMLRDDYPTSFQEELSPKEQEIVQLAERNSKYSYKTRERFESLMTKALDEARRFTIPAGIGVVVFAHKETQAWETMIASVINAGWIVTASWPLDTERTVRLRAMGSAALASSIHLVCRPREGPDGSVRTDEIGDWRDVLQALPRRIHQWMPRLAKEGVVGADAIFACLGPALEVFSRYSRVEKASGEQVALREYLEYVWAAVAQEALNMIFAGGDATGFEEDARVTAMWLWTLFAGTTNGDQKASELEGPSADESEDEQESTKGGKISGFVLEYDAARKIAQGLGARLESLPSLVEVKGDKARLLPVAERTKYLFSKDEAETPTKRKKKEPQGKLFEIVAEAESEVRGWGTKSAPKLGDTVLDRVHQSMILFAAGRGEALKRFLVDDGAGSDERFWRLAQALVALYPKGTDERRWIEGVMGRKKGLGF
jgi:putative DNA methylase